jgi:hypothetical protein
MRKDPMKLRALLAASALALAFALPVSAAPPVPTGTITIASVDPVIGGEVTFTVTTDNLKGNQYPLVYLSCVANGSVVYGQLDYPETVFILGGGTSPWIDPNDPNYLAPAVCTAYLYAYGGHPYTVLLAQAAAFAV